MTRRERPLKHKLKPDAVRVREAVQVRQQLQRLGAMQDPDAAQYIAELTNAYVRTAEAARFRLKVTDVHIVNVTLNPHVGQASGIALEAPSKQ